MSRTINWTPEKLAKLSSGLALAKKQRVTQFSLEIDGVKTEFDVGYAKYLVEYLEGEFGKRGGPLQPNNEGEESTSASSVDNDLAF